MRLILVRHAAAEPRAPGRDDAERALTPRGRRRFRAAVRGLEALDLHADRLLHSPWRRAAETAALLAGQSAAPPEATELLAGPPTEALLDLLVAERTLLVGHEPWLSALAGWLVTGAPGLGLDWKKGGVAVLDGEPIPGGARLRAFHPPRVLRRLGR